MRKNNVLSEINKVYGDYKIIEYIGIQSGCHKYKAQCLICNRIKEVWIKDLKRNIATSHKSCSWLLPKNSITKQLRIIWSHIIDRCTNQNCEHYDSYGGRGIKTQYIYFIDFYDDFYNSYIEHCQLFGVDNTTIERIDVNGNYDKANMKWDTWENQHGNTRRNKRIEITDTQGNISYINNVRKYCKENNLDASCIYDCLKGNLKTYKNNKYKYA